MVKARVLNPQSVWDVESVQASFREAGVSNVEQHSIRMWSYMLRNPSATWHVRLPEHYFVRNRCSACFIFLTHSIAQDVPDFPVAARAVLDAKYAKFTSKLHAVQRSTDGETFKLLISLQDGLRIEAVVMNYDTKLRNIQLAADDTDETAPVSGNVRSTLCVSSQVGCQMGCTFCATGPFPSISGVCARNVGNTPLKIIFNRTSRTGAHETKLRCRPGQLRS